MANLNNIIKVYLDDLFKVKENTQLELEVKFGTRGIKPIGQIDYGNVIKRLLSQGFLPTGNNKYLLRIQNEYTDLNTGVVRQSNLRTEIEGIHNIQQYCKTNRLDSISSGGLGFVQKEVYKRNQQAVYPVNVDDFNFRLSLSSENTLTSSTNMVKDTIEKWNDTKKTFRYLNRYSMKHPEMPFVVDLSIIKESKKKGNNYIPEYNFQEAGVLESIEMYNIEIECINSLVGIGTPFSTPALLNSALNKVIKFVLSGLQETNYPVAYSEQKMVVYDYMELLWNNGKKKKESAKEKEQSSQRLRVKPKNFIGPSSYTLEVQNIMSTTEDSNIPNIRTNYTVTDKADGDRKLLFIAPETGKIYLITTNMAVQFSGAVTRNKDLFNTLIDGEHILYNKNKKFINLYTAFDIYYLNGVDFRAKQFIPTKTDDLPTNFRLPLLIDVIKKMSPESIIKNSNSTILLPSPLRIEHKTFNSSSHNTIFNACNSILKKEQEGLFEYHTDGLIFTPTNLGVGANKEGEMIKPLGTTWRHSFKWKPTELNTIDFLISIKKMENGSDYVGNTFENGIDTKQSSQITQYKTVVLRVGFDENQHGFINPCQDIIDDNIPVYSENLYDDDSYKPVQFFPTQPSDTKAGIANILLQNGKGDDKVMLTEENEVIEDNMIVEFSYDMNKDEQWRWKPLRVRYDKTIGFRTGMNNFGNAYHVANSNWRTIHNPITKEMITLGINIPTELSEDDDVYYNRTSDSTNTRALRDFHNRYVKTTLLNSVATRNSTLIDLAVGKGGDLSKWINAKIKFVFGIDIKRDNIQNRLDGACSRYLKLKKSFAKMPDALFVNGNSSVNIRNTNAIYSEKDKQITKAVFGEGPKDAKALGKGVYKEYGIGKDGFDICSIQFAIHYMFENQDTLQNFLRNVSEVTKVGGYFIGTSYDGKIMFNKLKKLKEDESTSIITGKDEEKNKLWEVTKRYNRNDFPDNVSCLGYGIDVYQESINKIFREYLVNYDYLTQLLENYGFVLLHRDELKSSPISESTGLFTDLFSKMNQDIKRNPKLHADFKEAPNMTAGEREISFLNRYFIYKKVRKVDTDNVFLGLMKKTADQEKNEAEIIERANESVIEAVKTTEKPVKIKGKTKKIKLIMEE